MSAFGTKRTYDSRAFWSLEAFVTAGMGAFSFCTALN
jgi:hypothetical protein